VNSPPNSGPPSTPDPIDFRDRNAVERFLETEKFRRCTNLRCDSVSHPNMQMLYMPACLEGRFAKEGVAQHIELPLGSRPLSPVTYTTIPIWASLISCPPDCKGYRNRIVARVRAMFRRQSHPEGSPKSSKREWMWWIGILITVTGIVLALFRPEVRVWLRLEKPKPAVLPSDQSLRPQTIPASPSAPPEAKIEAKTQHAKTKVTGDNNVTGNNVAGNGNAVGNNNQTGPTANAPNGIAITGGTVTNPTVNNFGPPSLQITWSVSDTPPQGNFSFAKAVTVKTNVYYSPVYIAIFCDADVDDVILTRVSMGVTIGYVNNDKKSWYVRITGPPVTPDSPLTIVVESRKPFNVLDVRKVEVNQP
jgi:hypothetical protein